MQQWATSSCKLQNWKKQITSEWIQHFKEKRSRTVCRKTDAGHEAFMEYVDTLKECVAAYISSGYQ